MNHRKVLVVDDDTVAQQLLKEIIEKEGFQTVLASSGEEAIQLAQSQFFSIVLSDIRMLDLDGLDVLKYFREKSSETVVILLTAFGSLETAVEAIREGAFDYISKPFKIDEFRTIFRKAAKQAEALHISQNNQQNGNSILDSNPVKSIVGSSPQMLEIYKTLARAAISNAPVLILGESGTGKELIARAIQENSNRRNKKFISINCGAFSDTLLESELFGHTKGAFTGAHEARKGLFEEAHLGTIFLDEIGDTSQQMQVKLLRVLQEGEFRPLGANEVRKTDVRIITATHRNLNELVSSGKFREDLYYRLKVVSLEIPPLRSRISDIPELVNFFLIKYSKKNHKQVSHLTQDAMNTLTQYSWPGNVRELENVIERAVALANTSEIDNDDLPKELFNKTMAYNLNSLESLEKEHILKTLAKVNYNKSKAAELLGIDRTTLYRKAQKYGIDLSEK